VSVRRARRLLSLLLAAATAAPTATVAADKDRGKATTTVATELELSITLVESIGNYSGDVKVTTIDPAFVLTGTVTWVERPDVVALGSEQAFAIHSKAHLLLSDWKPGDKRCFNLNRTRREARTSWSLLPALGPRACKRAR
jgi:hypothetical protein